MTSNVVPKLDLERVFLIQELEECVLELQNLMQPTIDPHEVPLEDMLIDTVTAFFEDE
jgi:hypothetical protein